MSHRGSVTKRLLVAVVVVLFTLVGATGLAEADSYGELGHFGAPGTGEGQFKPTPSADAFGVDPSENSVYVVDEPKANEFRIQQFIDEHGTYKAAASASFKPSEAPKSEEPDLVEGVAVDSAKERVYVLVAQYRPPATRTIDPEVQAASALYAYSTKANGSKLEPVKGNGVFAGSTVLEPQSEEPGKSLLEPSGIAVDPLTHEVIITGKEDPGEVEEEPQSRVALETVTESGHLGEHRYVDSSDYFAGEAITSPAVSPAGKVYAVLAAGGGDEIAEIPSNFAESTSPKPAIVFDSSKERLTRFPGEPFSGHGADLSIGPEGTIDVFASIKLQIGKESENFSYPGAVEFNADGTEEGWTGGQSEASGSGKCVISFFGDPAVGAGKEHKLFIYDANPEDPRVVEFGPGGDGCPKAKVTSPSATVDGIAVGSSPVPIAEKVTLSSVLTQANAESVEWEFGDGSPKQTVSTPQYQQTEVTHVFARTGKLTVKEIIHTDDLAEPEVTKTSEINIVASPPVVVTGTATAIEGTSATVTGTVNPNGGTISECYFEYGTSETYGKRESCASLPKAGAINPQPASAAIKGLSEHTTYHFRLVAKGETELVRGSDETLKTGPNPPILLTGAASAVERVAATLNATVNPNGNVVEECYFQYGASLAYGSTAPCSALPGGGSSPVAVSALLSGLSANTTYQFRIVAKSKGGIEYGGDKAFTTAEEVVIVPPGEVGPTPTTPTTTTTPPPPPIPPVVTLVGAPAAVSSAGALAVKVTCPAAAGSCAGTVTVQTQKAVLASKGRKGKPSILTLATGSFSVLGGQIKTVMLHLSAKARSLLARSHALGARVTITARSPGGATHTTVVTITLRAAKGKHGR